MIVGLLVVIAAGVVVMASETIAFAVIKLRARRVELHRARALVRAHADALARESGKPAAPPENPSN